MLLIKLNGRKSCRFLADIRHNPSPPPKKRAGKEKEKKGKENKVYEKWKSLLLKG